MAEIVTKQYQCDGCKKLSDRRDFNDGYQEGTGVLKFTGSRGYMSFQGDWGGSNFNVEKLLCFNCSDKLHKFLLSLSETENDK